MTLTLILGFFPFDLGPYRSKSVYPFLLVSVFLGFFFIFELF